MKLAITSGYFNPIHPGHIECFKLAKEIEGVARLVVIVNSDSQAELKRGVTSFQNENDRMKIVESIKWVDEVFLSKDEDLTVRESLRDIIIFYQNKNLYSEILFVKGGDRFSGNTPEKEICEELGVTLIDGLGAKTHNSSDYIKK